jgi:ABC-2 type transport system ATP-binding protein
MSRSERARISCLHLCKRYGAVRAVRDLSFDVPAGTITGFIGAGKTSTIRMLLGLVEPTSGQALIDGRRMREIDNPRRTVGAVLDSPGAHPGHTGRAHLGILAAAAGIDRRRVEEMLGLVEMAHAAHRRVGEYSLGMRQRLAIAGALLGRPEVLLLDEPTKGLDPPGMAWLRRLLRDLAAGGCALLVSSHHLAELEHLADRWHRRRDTARDHARTTCRWGCANFWNPQA